MFLIPDGWHAVRAAKKRGRGAFALRDIPPGTVIGDYLGTIVRPDDVDEKKNGLYDMGGGEKYDILGDPRVNGIHLINHSCAQNCEVYPYRGHMLYFALRRIFKGEEITVNYDLCAEYEEKTTCNMHACFCGSELCTGTMHHAWSPDDTESGWDRLKKKAFGPYYRAKVPGRYGEQLQPLGHYPRSIADRADLYDIFGAEGKPALRCADRMMPSVAKVRKLIRESGRRLAFPELRLTVYGMRDGMIIAAPRK